MKNIKYIVLFILVLLSSGCSYFYASTTRNIRHSGFNIVGNKFVCTPIIEKKEIKDKVKFYSGNILITESGNLYEINLGKVYSNDMNCKKPDFSVKVSAIFDLSIVKGDDDNYYYLGGSTDIEPYSLVTTNNEDYALYDILLEDEDVVKVNTVNKKDGIYYVLKTDGNIYQYNINKNNNVYKLLNNFLLYDKSDYDSKIVDFSYNGSNSTTYVKTEKSYYRMHVTNGDECYKYADIACKYEMDQDEKLTKEMDRVLAYNGSSLISTYGKVFSVNN